MGWRETINNRLRESFQIFYELEVAQHAKAHIAAFHKFGELFGFDSKDKKQMLDFATSPDGHKAMVLFRKYSNEVSQVKNPDEWGAAMAQRIYDEIMSVGANNG